MGIYIVGNAFLDIKGFPIGSFVPTGKNAGKVEFVHGGVGRNIAEDIGNLELKPSFVSMVDDTDQGTAVLEKLKKHKVNVEHTIVAKDGMGMWLAVFDEQGDVAASVSKRPNMKPLEDYICNNGDRIFSEADAVVVEIDLDKEIVKQTIRFAQKYNKPVYGVVANISLACERRDFIKQTDCFICNKIEAEHLFIEDFSRYTPKELSDILLEKIRNAVIPSMIVTIGENGAVYASLDGVCGVCDAENVVVQDTTGAGDAFCAGVTAGLTYGKTLKESTKIGTRLAAAVIQSSENTCPRFLPKEFGIDKECHD